MRCACIGGRRPSVFRSRCPSDAVQGGGRPKGCGVPAAHWHFRARGCAGGGSSDSANGLGYLIKVLEAGLGARIGGAGDRLGAMESGRLGRAAIDRMGSGCSRPDRLISCSVRFDRGSKAAVGPFWCVTPALGLSQHSSSMHTREPATSGLDSGLTTSPLHPFSSQTGTVSYKRIGIRRSSILLVGPRGRRRGGAILAAVALP